MGFLFLGLCVKDDNSAESALVLNFYNVLGSKGNGAVLENISLRSLGRLSNDGLVFLPEMFGFGVKDTDIMKNLIEFFRYSKHGLHYDEGDKEIHDSMGNKVPYFGYVVNVKSLIRELFNFAIASTNGEEAIKIDINNEMLNYDKVGISDLDEQYKVYKISGEAYHSLFEED